MYKLLLVDDEPIIREGLERMIDWEKLSLKMTASCPNAIAALDLGHSEIIDHRCFYTARQLNSVKIHG